MMVMLLCWQKPFDVNRMTEVGKVVPWMHASWQCSWCMASMCSCALVTQWPHSLIIFQSQWLLPLC